VRYKNLQRETFPKLGQSAGWPSTASQVKK
jgi:hypothetical protein